MKHYGFITVAAAVPSLRVADCTFNAHAIAHMMDQASEGGAEILCLPELCLTGSTCQDLFRNRLLIDKAHEALLFLLERSKNLDLITIVGMPFDTCGGTSDNAVVIQHGNIKGIVTKGTPSTLFTTASGVRFAVAVGHEALFETSPAAVNEADADIVFHLSALGERVGMYSRLRRLVSLHSERAVCGYVYAGSGFGESTQDTVYGGNTIIAESGTIIAEGQRFSLSPQIIISQIDIERLRAERHQGDSLSCSQEAVAVSLDGVTERPFSLLRTVNPLPFVPSKEHMADSCDEIIDIQSTALMQRLSHTHCQTVVIGISGGLDSTLALLICVEAFNRLGIDRKGIVGVTMPSFGTSTRTHSNANELMDTLCITAMEIDITKSVAQHFQDIHHDINHHDVTYENAQARERTQILMDLANRLGGMVIGTGDLSELALGWCTYNGDHMSMYAVNAGMPKTLIPHVIRRFAHRMEGGHIAATLLDIIATPISPELLPADDKGDIAQKTEDLVGPYELHDFFLYHFVRFGFSPSKIFMLAQAAFQQTDTKCVPSAEKPPFYDDATIKRWLTTFFRRFFNQQFKRSCMPDGPQVVDISLSPRGAWSMPSDATATLWLEECERL